VTREDALTALSAGVADAARDHPHEQVVAVFVEVEVEADAP